MTNNPFGTDHSKRDETNRVIASLGVFIADQKTRAKAIDYVKKHRHAVIAPDRLFGKRGLPDEEVLRLALGGVPPGELLLRRLIALAPASAPKVEDIRLYFTYCRKLFDIAGLYALEDPYVRLFFYISVANQKTQDRGLRNSLEKAFRSLLTKREINRLQKHLRARQTGESLRDIQRAHAYLLYTVSGKRKSFRAIGKAVGISKDTAKAYIKKAEEMPPNERAEWLGVMRPRLPKMVEIPEDFDESMIPAGRRKRPVSLQDYEE